MSAFLAGQVEAPTAQHFREMRRLWLGAEVCETLVLPWILPTQNKAFGWHPMARAKNVRMIHEAVAIAADHMFTDQPLPDEWAWHDPDERNWPLKSGRVTMEWFTRTWHKQVLCRKTYEPPGTGTIVEVLRLQNNRVHLHVHSLIWGKIDQDGMSLKHLQDGLTHAGFFPDDNPDYLQGNTQTYERVAGTRKRIQTKR